MRPTDYITVGSFSKVNIFHTISTISKSCTTLFLGVEQIGISITLDKHVLGNPLIVFAFVFKE